MALTEKNTYQVEITDTDHVQVRIRRIIMDNGEVISSAFGRHVVSPGQDFSGEIGKVRRMAAAAHVPTVVDRYARGQDWRLAKEVRDEAARIRIKDDTPENQAIEAAAEQELLDAEAAAEAAEAAHEAFLAAEDA